MPEIALDNEWRPIETAPKNGSKILVVNNGHVSMAYWGGKRPPCWKNAGHHCSISEPTHWMPLPQPPQP